MNQRLHQPITSFLFALRASLITTDLLLPARHRVHSCLPSTPPGAPSERRFFCLMYDTKTRSSIVCFESAQLPGCCAANMTKSHERKSALLKTTSFKFPSQSKKTNKQKKHVHIYASTKQALHGPGMGLLRIFSDLLQITVEPRESPSTTWQFQEGFCSLYLFIYFFNLRTLALAAKSRVQPAGLVCTLHAAG